MEQLIKNIVVGFDFSDQAREALGTALAMARKVGAEVHVVSALPGHIDPVVVKKAAMGATPRRDQLYANEAFMENLGARLEGEVASLGSEGLKVTSEVSQRRPLLALFETATIYKSDLIVVGATGLGAIRRFLMGSTSQKLVRKSRWPVMIVKPGQDFPPRRILCPVDFSPASRRALGWAGELAALYGARVDVLYVDELLPRQWVDIYGDFYDTGMAQTHNERRGETLKQVEAFCDIEDLEGVSWEPLIVSGRPDEVIVETAVSHESDLIAMGSVGRAGVEGILVGNTAERVLRELPCSILTAKPDDFVLKT